MKILRFVRYRYQKSKTEWELIKLNLLIYFCAYVILAVAFSIILFHIELNVPGTPIKTIQDSLWSIMSALSSVGFGDTFPISFPGRLFLGFVMVVGVGFLSFAILIVGRVFQVVIFGKELESELAELSRSHREFHQSHRRLLRQEGADTIE